MTKIEKIKKEIANLYENIEEKRVELKALQAESYYKCPNCGKSTKIKNVGFITPYWYVEPYSCTGGDYWKLSEDREIYCPKCGKHNNLFKDNKLFSKYCSMKPLFGQKLIKYKAGYGEVDRYVEDTG